MASLLVAVVLIVLSLVQVWASSRSASK
jgi:hypothetical protein